MTDAPGFNRDEVFLEEDESDIQDDYEDSKEKPGQGRAGLSCEQEQEGPGDEVVEDGGPFFAENGHQVQAYEWNKHNEHVDISAVDVAPEDGKRDDEPDIQYVSICGEDKEQ